jgi:hypothetical protein
MRRWFVLLMIALLPLRGLVGDAMAADMMAKHLSTAQTAVETASAHHEMDPDCMGHSHANADTDANADADASVATNASPCPTCASCQVCSSVALAFAASVAVSPVFTQPTPVATLATFASADPATGFKPPIS